MSDIVDLLLTRTWWTYDPKFDWYAQPYHWLNLVEGCLWLVFSALVFRRYRRQARAPIELVYCAAFLRRTFLPLSPLSTSFASCGSRSTRTRAAS